MVHDSLLSVGLGHANEAIRGCSQRSVDLRKSLGANHPDFATSLNQLSLLLIMQGEADSAEPFLRQALEIRRVALGELHPDYATNLSSLGGILWARGDLDGAEPILRRAAEIRSISLGFDHPKAVISRNSVEQLLQARRDWEADCLARMQRAQNESNHSIASESNNAEESPKRTEPIVVEVPPSDSLQSPPAAKPQPQSFGSESTSEGVPHEPPCCCSKDNKGLIDEDADNSPLNTQEQLSTWSTPTAPVKLDETSDRHAHVVTTKAEPDRSSDCACSIEHQSDDSSNPSLSNTYVKLRRGFTDVAGSCLSAGQVLRDRGEVPSEIDLKRWRSALEGFRTLRLEILDALQAADIKLDVSIENLEQVGDLLEGLNEALKRASHNQFQRDEAIRILRQVALLRCPADPSFKPLADCQAKALALLDALRLDGKLGPTLLAFARELSEGGGRHPFSALVLFVEKASIATDHEWSAWYESVAGFFGSPLAAAVSRRKIIL